MKYIISEEKLNELILQYLNILFLDIKKIDMTSYGTSKNYINFVDYNDNLVVDGIIGKELFVDEKIWGLVKSFFKISDEEVAEHIEKWMEINYGYSFDGNVMKDRNINFPND